MLWNLHILRLICVISCVISVYITFSNGRLNIFDYIFRWTKLSSHRMRWRSALLNFSWTIHRFPFAERYKIIVSHWLHGILLRLTPAGSPCWNQYTSPRTDTFDIVSWYIQKVLFLSRMLSHFVSIDSYQHRSSSCFVFDFPKLNLCQHVFTLNFFICACEYILFL